MNKHLILIGYRGVGKSTIAKFLSETTGMAFKSTDEEIEKKLGTTILNYIESGHSWESFRVIETQVLKECLNTDESIILDCGGGIVETAENRSVLKQAGDVFWLKASVPIIIERMKQSDIRPSLSGTKPFDKEVEEILNRRIPLYQATCHKEIDTEGDKIYQAPSQILKLFQLQR